MSSSRPSSRGTPTGTRPCSLEALERHCSDLGRDRASIGVTWLASLVLGATREEAESKRDAALRRRGLEYGSLPDVVREAIDRALLLGDADHVGEILERRVASAGLDGVIVNLPVDAWQEGSVENAADLLRRVFG